jgi:hypothetical protein
VPITASSVLVASPEQVSRELAGESVILHVTSGIYYGVEGVAARVWSLLQQPTTLPQLTAAITEEYDVSADRCRTDLLALLTRLAQIRVIEVRDAV